MKILKFIYFFTLLQHHFYCEAQLDNQDTIKLRKGNDYLNQGIQLNKNTQISEMKEPINQIKERQLTKTIKAKQKTANDNLKFEKSKKLKKDLWMLKKYSNYHVSHQKSFMKKFDTQDTDSSYRDLPKNFLKWKDYMPTPRNQVFL